MNEKDYKEHLQGLCVVEISGESCANCLTLMPILKELFRVLDHARLGHSLLSLSNPHL